MQIRPSLFTAVLTLLLATGSAYAVPTHDIVLGADEVFQISATEAWQFEVQREQAGRFADVRVSPRRGDSFVLTLYFIADTPAQARLDSPEKMARSVIASSEKYLPDSLETEIRLQPIKARRSYGSLTVLTASAGSLEAGGYKYLTRGMLRIAPESALGFRLLSKELDTAAYTRLLNYVYGFIKLAPTVSPAPPTAVIEAHEKAVPAPRAGIAPATVTPKPAKRGSVNDLRDCLNATSNAEIMRCASGGR